MLRSFAHVVQRKTFETERVIFLDFDGVIRVVRDDGGLDLSRAVFCRERIERVRVCCSLLDAKVVVSSDWRTMENRSEIESFLGPLAGRLHRDWATPIAGKRWSEVGAWLLSHPEVREYAILEDWKGHFLVEDGCPPEMESRVVWCNNRFGFVESLTGRLCALFNPQER